MAGRSLACERAASTCDRHVGKRSIERDGRAGRAGFQVIDTDEPGWTEWSDSEAGFVCARTGIPRRPIGVRSRTVPLRVRDRVESGQVLPAFDEIVLDAQLAGNRAYEEYRATGRDTKGRHLGRAAERMGPAIPAGRDGERDRSRQPSHQIQ